ncbi:hypothetical protein [Anatilimnocola floriformis]|uniref:hypothetical protein n=1 Tax=Anatilimnocola floriformis TaxID=2948575 RepID=UPI0020C35BBB|nr:hypothetical protein [Anatilimnocola floriformis]
MSRAVLLGMMNDGIFRGRFTVQGFAATAADKLAMREHVRNLAPGQLPAELARRYSESGL